MTLAAIVFGVAGLILSGGFVEDSYRQLAEAVIHSQSGHLQIAKTGYFTYGSRTPEKYLVDPPGPEIARVMQRPQVADAMARLSFAALLGNGRSDVPISGEGIEPDKEAALGTFVRINAGRQLSSGDQYGVLIGEGIARTLQLRPGDPATLLASTPDGAMNTLEVTVVGVFQSFSRDYDARAVRIPLSAAQELLNVRGANTIVISLRNTADTTQVAGAEQRSVRERGLEVQTWRQLNDFYEKTVLLYDRQFGVLQVIILTMVLLSVMNTVNMTVFERVGEFGTIRALGNRSSYVVRLVLTECLLLGIVGALLGVLSGAVLAAAISAVGIPMPPPPNSDLAYTARIQLVPSVMLGAFLVGVVAAGTAGVLPALRASRMPVIEALRHVS